MMSKPALPTVLTEPDWKKKKGIFAKAGGKTGISEALRQLKLAYDRVNWNAVAWQPALKALGELTPAGLTSIERDYQAARGGLVNLHKALVQVEVVATKTLVKYKKSTLIPASSIKQVEAILKTVKETRLRWAPALADRNWKETLGKFRAQAEENQELAQSILNNCDILAEYLDRLQAKPTMATFTASRPQVLRAAAELIDDIRELDRRSETPGRFRPRVGPFPGFNAINELRVGRGPDTSAADLTKLVLQVRSGLERIRAFARPR
jgi:hypothetical protein